MKNSPQTSRQPLVGKKISYLAGLIIASLVTCHTTYGATLTWDADTGTSSVQDGDGTWTTSGSNWYTGSSDTAWANNSDVVFGKGGTGGSGTSTVTLATSATAKSLTFNTSSTTGRYSLAGSGTITLNGGITANTSATIGNYLDRGSGNTLSINTNAGILELSGGVNAYGISQSGTTGTLLITGGTVSLGAGVLGNPSNTNIFMEQTGGLVSITGGAVWKYKGGYTITGGTLSMVSTNTSNYTADNMGVINASGNSVVAFVANGGAEYRFADGGTSSLSINDNAYVSLTGAGVKMTQNGTDVATINLNGGTLQLRSFSYSTGTNAINFNGGALQLLSSGGNAAGYGSNGGSYVYGGGAVFDTSVNANTVSSGNAMTYGNLIGRTGYGVSSVVITGSGSGYSTAPTVIFSAPSGGGQAATGYAVIDPNGNLVKIVITNPGYGYASGETPTVTIAGSTATATAALNNANGGVTVTGGNTMVLGGSNSYTGATKVINNSTIVFSGTKSLYGGNTAQWTAGNLVVNSGATAAFTVGGSGNFTSANLDTLRGLATATSGFMSGASFGIDTTGGSFTYSSNITDTNSGANVLGLAKIGANTLTLNGSNSYTGVTNVREGALLFSGTASLYGGNKTKWTANNLVVNSGATAAFSVGGATDFTATDIDNFRTLATATSGFMNGAIIGIDTTNASSGFTYASNITDTNGGANALGFAKLGANTLTITGSNSHSGGTYINGGTLKIGAGGVLSGTTGLLTMGGGQLDLGNTTQTVGAIMLNAGSGSGDTILGGTLVGSSLTANPTSGNTTISASLVLGSGMLTKNNSGTLILSASNSYTGGTLLNQGMIKAGNNYALGSGAVTVSNNGGTIGASTTGIVLGNAFNIAANSLTIDATNSPTFSGNISGSAAGLSTIQNSGSVTLGGVNNLGYTSANAGLTVKSSAVANITGATTLTGSANNSGFFALTGGTVNVIGGGSLTANGYSTATTTAVAASVVGLNGAGLLNIGAADKSSSGTVTIGGNTGFVIGSGGSSASSGVLNVNSGMLTINKGTVLAAAGATEDNTLVEVGRTTSGSVASSGTINLNGGTLATDRQFVRGGHSGGTGATSAYFVFNGGTLMALGAQSDWIQSTATNANNSTALAFTSVTTGTSALVQSTIDANSFTVAINNNISGAGGLNIADSSVGGGGVVKLGGANTYTGATSVSGGELDVNGSLAVESAVDIQSGATLGGSGTVSGITTVRDGGSINGTGLTLGAVIFNGIGTLKGNNSAVSVSIATGTTTLSGTTTATGGINVSVGGALNATGHTASKVTVDRAVLKGTGSVGSVVLSSGTLCGTLTTGDISGTGLVSPGNSPGVLTASSVTSSASSGLLSFAFELTANAPDYTSSTNSLNDVLHVTTSNGLTIENGTSISVYFSSLSMGGKFDGGFFVDGMTTAALLNAVSNATFTYYVEDAAGSTTFNGHNYSLVSQQISISAVDVEEAAFETGKVNGAELEFTVVPEPATWALLVGGLGMLIGVQRMRRKQNAM